VSATAVGAPPGYAFDADFDGTIASGTVLGDGTLALFLFYPASSYTVTFNANGGATASPASKTVAFNTAYGSLASTSRTGYTFNGWFTAATGGSQVTAATIMTNPSNHTLFAQWSILSYTVTFVDHDGTELKKETVDFGSAATAPAAPTRVGYTFDRWDKDFSNITGNLTVNALYTMNTYTVTFIGFADVVLDTQQVSHGSGAIAPTAPVVAGFTFTGWDVAFNNITGPLTVRAIYTEILLPPPPVDPDDPADPADPADPVDPVDPTPPTPPVITPVVPPGPGTPVAPLVAAPLVPLLVAPAPEPEAEPEAEPTQTITPTPTPVTPPPTITIEEKEVPLATPVVATWALMNLLLACAGILMALMLLIALASRRKTSNESSDKKKSKGGMGFLAVNILVAVVAVVLFFVTQNLFTTMIITDNWTVVHAILFVVQIAIVVLAMRSGKEEKEAYASAK
ncbi:MAG: InlB B-repeat-containing protein, partial [Coriobacteriia bacterium]|nr:InlB B-repeat-containing protein [Coriobacteriia bacterium]